MKRLVEKLVASGVLHSPSIIQAFLAVDRRDFVPPKYRQHSYEDRPVPIGFGQTISQPTTVAFMLEQLRPQLGQSILDVGAGSGWQTALLASIVGSDGQVVAVEIIPELLAQAEQAIAPYELKNITWVLGSARDPATVSGLFDRIIIAAASAEIPQHLLQHLKLGGRLVAPVGLTFGQDIVVLEKPEENRYANQRFPGFVFVPLVER